MSAIGCKEEDKYILNGRGAKIYLDIDKQPVLNITGPIVCEVLSAGVFMDSVPLITVQENDKKICYRIPDDYLDWINMCMTLASMNIYLFPCKVMFNYVDDEYFANIL